MQSLGHYDVGRRDEERRRGQHREPGEGDQAQPVQHHGRELPVVLLEVFGVVRLDLVGEDAELLEDHGQLPHGARRQRRQLLFKERQIVGRPAIRIVPG